jgi:hypothetical protein
MPPGPETLKPQTLAIFDYSGTLSPGAVDFGKPDSLTRHLAESGLAAIGIDTPERYWHAVVGPTWNEASTAPTGFQASVTACIAKMGLPGVTRRAIYAAVSGFLAAYLQHSSIAPAWAPLLTHIQSRPGILGLVATDHYAEATAAVQSHLSALGIAATPAVMASPPDNQSVFRVANSADIGSLKAQRLFWETLKKTCLSMPLARIIVIDDFGASEQDLSGYADPRKIEKRIEATRRALDAIFGISPRIIHFTPGKDADGAIAKTSDMVRKALP